MDKPESVEAGQWWQFNDEPPRRIFQQAGAHWFDIGDGCKLCDAAALFNERYTYLGSGPHPEPSEWMIETCARHLWAMRSAGHDHAEWDQQPIERRTRCMGDVKRILASTHHGNGVFFQDVAVVLSLHRILRDLGKW